MADSDYVPRGFHWADYVIFGATIVMSSAIGVFFACSGGKQKTTAEYLLGNRKQKVGPVAMSLIVSFESSIMMLGFPAEMYAYGTHYWMGLIGYFFCCLIISQTFVPLLHPLKLTSSYEYLDMRFNSRPVRLVASVLGVINYSWYMGIVLFGPATALEAVTGFPIVYSVILVTIAAVFYTTIGGIKAVIWSDALQFIIMLMGIMAVVIAGIIAVGGVGSFLHYLEKGGRIKLYDFNPDPRTRHTFWNLIVGGSIRALGLGINQSSVQRISSMKTLTGAKVVMLLTFPGFFLFSSLAYLEGLIAYSYFAHTHCDPLGAKLVTNPNQILPYFVMELFRKQPGLPGLFLASLFSASLSTLSSGFSAMSAILWSDFLKPCFPKVSELTATLITKSTVLFLGCLAIGIAFLVMQIGGPLNQISGTILGSMGGPLTGLFVLGALFPSATAKVVLLSLLLLLQPDNLEEYFSCTVAGAISGSIGAFALVFWIAMGSSFSPLTVKTPYLPAAPIDQCPGYNNSAGNLTMAAWNASDYMSTGVPVAENDISVELPEKIYREYSGIDSFLSYLYSLSYMWYSLIGMILTVAFGLIVSHATGANPPGTIDPKYIIPIFDQLFCYLPSSVRDKLRYGKDFIPKDEDVKEEELIKVTDDGDMYLIVEPEPVVETDLPNDTKSLVDEQRSALLEQRIINGKIE
ncbi:sodium-coupled monocarboxylate transporter 2-like [Liolophura sinensis]|uniref:sodium-coupled monocarboxylate transporter 2-like n=1 Tax=Liolophura sinensis TaxID=3198878 RepID=UPI0031580216